MSSRTIAWAAIYSILWAVLSQGSGWLLGIPFVILATAVTTLLHLPLYPVALRRLPAFFLWFLAESLRGAWDVALRTLGLSARMEPGWVVYPVSLQDLHVRLLFSAIPGLLPGTLAASIRNDEMHLHLLDTRQDWESSIRALERQLTALFPAIEGEPSP